MKKSVSIYDLKVGCELADDIKARDGQTLIVKGVVLNERHIERLRQWFANSNYEFLIDVPDEEDALKKDNNNIKMEQLQTETIDFLNSVLNSTGLELNKALDSSKLNIAGICEDLKSISDLPDDVIKIMYHNNPGSHYFRVTRMAVALASIYNKNKPKDMQIPLESICLAALLHDYGKRFKNDSLGIRNLTFDRNTLSGTNINPNSIGAEYDSDMHTVYSYVAFKGKIPEDVRRMILYSNYHDFNSSISVRPDVKAANIISLCDIYDSLLEHVMKNDLSSPFENVISYMDQLAHNRSLDADTYKLFKSHFTIYPHGVKVLLSDGNQAIVVGKSDDFPTKPSVLVLGHGGTNLLDLSQTTNITIRRVLHESPEDDKKIKEIQDSQIQTSAVPDDISRFVPSDDATRTIELQAQETDKQKALSKKLKDFFGR